MTGTPWPAMAAAFGALLIASCSGERSAAAPTQAEAGDKGLARANAVVADSVRLDDDFGDDDMRKPAEVLRFIGIQPGMTVFEVEAGRGYYTELFSKLVGPDGHVIMQNPPSFDVFLDEPVTARLADNRLPNVRLSKSAFDELDAETGSADIVTWLLGPHELYFTPSDGASLGEVEPAYDEVYRVLKPGGTFVILDHAAPASSPETTGGALHRIDPAIVKALAEQAGFELVEESDVLRNSDDMYDMSVFDPQVRRRTDRFLLKYRKPG